MSDTKGILHRVGALVKECRDFGCTHFLNDLVQYSKSVLYTILSILLEYSRYTIAVCSYSILSLSTFLLFKIFLLGCYNFCKLQ